MSVLSVCFRCLSSTDGSTNVGNSSVGDSDTVAHQTMADDTTVGDAMPDHTTVSNAMADTSNSSGEGSSAVVGDLSDVSINVVSVVVDVLDPSVGQVDRVVSLPGCGAIVSLGSVKAGSRVVVSNGILVGVGGDLVGVDLSNGMGNWVSNSMTNNSVANTVANKAMADSHTMSKRVSDRSNERGGNSMANSSNKTMT